MAIFKKKTEDGKSTRDISALLPIVLIMMLISAIVGIGVSIVNINSNSRIQTINEYIDSAVVFSVVGYGEYQGTENTERSEGIIEAYDIAYAEALEKASLIAANSGNNWRITKVEEVDSTWSTEEHTATTAVRMSFAIVASDD